MHSEPIMIVLDITNKECIMTASTAIILIILVVIVVLGIVWGAKHYKNEDHFN